MKKWAVIPLLIGCLLLAACRNSNIASAPPPVEPAEQTSSPAPQVSSGNMASKAPEVSSAEAESKIVDENQGVKTALPEEEMEQLHQMFNIFWIALADVEEGKAVPPSIAYAPFLLIRDTENTADPKDFQAALQEFWGREVPLFQGDAPEESLIPLSLEEGRYTLPAMGLNEWHHTQIEAAYRLKDGRYRLVGVTKYYMLGEDGFTEQLTAVARFEGIVRHEPQSRFHYQVLAQRYFREESLDSTAFSAVG